MSCCFPVVLECVLSGVSLYFEGLVLDCFIAGIWVIWVTYRFWMFFQLFLDWFWNNHSWMGKLNEKREARINKSSAGWASCFDSEWAWCFGLFPKKIHFPWIVWLTDGLVGLALSFWDRCGLFSGVLLMVRNFKGSLHFFFFSKTASGCSWFVPLGLYLGAFHSGTKLTFCTGHHCFAGTSAWGISTDRSSASMWGLVAFWEVFWGCGNTVHCQLLI